MPRIGIYTIALNEEKCAQRWADCVVNADYALVVDTGSTDGTKEILQSNGIDVRSIAIAPWRFDDARNAAMALLPADLDIVVSLDLDERLTSGWRDRLEECWSATTTRLHYRYIWSWTSQGEPDVVFQSDKITGRFTHRWKNPVHEILTPTTAEVLAFCDTVLIEHHPDSTKSRGQYLSLLKLSTMEDPENDRNAHYLGREYYFHGEWRMAIDEFHRHLGLRRATWNTERAASMRYIAKCHAHLGETDIAGKWYSRATLEDPTSREPLVDLAKFCVSQKMFYGAIDACHRAMILPVSTNYMNERYARAEGVFDLLAVSHWHIGQKALAADYAEQAVTHNPSDPRLLENLRMIKEL